MDPYSLTGTHIFTLVHTAIETRKLAVILLSSQNLVLITVLEMYRIWPELDLAGSTISNPAGTGA